MTVMGIAFEWGSEPFGPKQRVGQVEQQAERDEAGERVIEDHGALLSQPFAGIGVTYPRDEEAKAERQHDDVQHGMFLCDVIRDAEDAAIALDGREVPPRA
jgi:hypothetical protein